MSERFHKSEFIPPEERNLHQLHGKTLKEVIEYLEGTETDEELSIRGEPVEQIEQAAIFDGFLSLLREKGVRVSTPEWMQFLTVIGKKTSPKELKELVSTNELLNKVRLFAKTTLVKDKADESAFHEAFDEYFELAEKVYNLELENQQAEEKKKQEAQKDETTGGEQPDIKEQLGIKEVDENLNPPEGEHKDDEQVHGGKKDQHNDILRKADLAKQGGGNKKEGPKGEGDKGQPSEGKGDKGEAGAGKGDKGKPSGIMGKGGKEGAENGEQTGLPPESPESEQQQLTQEGFLVGGGKGKSIYAERVGEQTIVHEGERVSKEEIATRKERVGRVDRRTRYEVRPDKASMREVIRNIRRIITDVSEIKSGTVDIKRTTGNFARRDFRFDYEKEREKQPEIVLFIDVGGPVDEWSPLVNEVAEAMTEGLTKLEVYLFHNNLYGYVWKPDPKNLLASSYAKPDSLIDVKKRADSVVWINPVFKKEWEERDDSGTIHAAKNIVPMHDLTVGGVEDAIKELMKK